MDTKAPARKVVPWTKKDAKIVAEYFPDGGVGEVNAAFGRADRPVRSPDSIRRFACDIGVHRTGRKHLRKKKESKCPTSSATK